MVRMSFYIICYFIFFNALTAYVTHFCYNSMLFIFNYKICSIIFLRYPGAILRYRVNFKCIRVKWFLFRINKVTLIMMKGITSLSF